MENPFAGLGAASTNKGGVYFGEGHDGLYTVEILRCLLTQNKEGHHCFVVEMRILESACPERPAGMQVSQVINLTKHKLSAMGNLKTFLGVLLEMEDADGYTPPNGQTKDAFWTEIAGLAVHEGQPFAGFHVTLNVRVGNTRSGGKFTHYNWTDVVHKPE